MDELAKPQLEAGMGETRLRAATLLCKVFLQYVVRLSEGDVVGELFVKVLEKLERFMKGERDMVSLSSLAGEVSKLINSERSWGITQECHSRHALFRYSTSTTFIWEYRNDRKSRRYSYRGTGEIME